jgi:hypothetical protein
MIVTDGTVMIVTDGIVMIVTEVLNLVTIPMTKSSQYLYTWSEGSFLLLKSTYTSLNLQIPLPNQLLSNCNNIRPLLSLYGHFDLLLSVSKSSGCSYTFRFSD